jgi:hypothetical protein
MVNLLLAASLAAMACMLVITPIDAPAEPQRAEPGNESIADISDHAPRPLSAYAEIHKRLLRKPLFDPKPAAIAARAKKAPPPKPKLTLSLTGTVLEPGFTYAMLKGVSGQVKFVAIGQTLDNATVTAITANSATLKFHGDLITLQVNQGGR